MSSPHLYQILCPTLRTLVPSARLARRPPAPRHRHLARPLAAAAPRQHHPSRPPRAAGLPISERNARSSCTGSSSTAPLSWQPASPWGPQPPAPPWKRTRRGARRGGPVGSGGGGGVEAPEVRGRVQQAAVLGGPIASRHTEQTGGERGGEVYHQWGFGWAATLGAEECENEDYVGAWQSCVGGCALHLGVQRSGGATAASPSSPPTWTARRTAAGPGAAGGGRQWRQLCRRQGLQAGRQEQPVSVRLICVNRWWCLVWQCFGSWCCNGAKRGGIVLLVWQVVWMPVSSGRLARYLVRREGITPAVPKPQSLGLHNDTTDVHV